MKRMKGFEPSTFAMARRRSSQLSYIRVLAAFYPARPDGEDTLTLIDPPGEAGRSGRDEGGMLLIPMLPTESRTKQE